MQNRSLWVWGRLIALILVGLGFLGFGVLLLISAYHLTDPFIFVLTFFSSNFIILISAALVVGLVIRAVTLRKAEDE
jgi:hypothetical protein